MTDQKDLNTLLLPETLESMSDENLTDLRANLEVEMRRRGLEFSIGDIGESLILDHFNSTPGLPMLQLAPTGTKNIDAISRDGERYSIKTVKKAKKTGTIYPDRENQHKQLFEFLLIAKLDDELKLIALHEFSWDHFTNVRSWDKRMSAWYVPYTMKALGIARSIL